MYQDIIKNAPAVFAVGESYQIMVGVTCQTMMWVEIAGERYYNHSNGIMRSAVTMHRVTVPREALDAAGGYSVYFEKIIDRKPYFPETEEPVSQYYPFTPVKNGAVRAFQVADAHNHVDGPAAACAAYVEKYGPIDFLIMNGDIPNHSGDVKFFDTIYEIAAKITGGSIPIVFARGNHDLRGVHAEEIADYTPNLHGNTYFTCRVGDIWALVLDTGEDKDDSHPEYGHTVCCHAFRKEETRFIENVIKNSEREYNAPGVRRKIVVMHNPLTYKSKNDCFNIEPELFTYWAKLMREEIGVDAMICGHLHTTHVYMPGDEYDLLGHPCPIIVGSMINHKTGYFVGMGLEFGENDVKATFIDSDGSVTGEEIVKL